MIPKIIHYCWFGNNEKNKLVEFCMASWQKHLPEYKVIKWDESNFELKYAPFYVKKAYESKKWAFVSDYVRAYALYNIGGIYLDTDVEIKYNFDVFLSHKAFSGFELKGSPFTAVWASEKNHNWPKLVLAYYHQQNEFSILPNTSIVSDILVTHYKVNREKNQLQLVDEGIAIYPSDTFCIDIPVNYACHHFNGSWLEDEDHYIAYKDLMSLYYYEEKYHNILKVMPDINFQKEITKKIKTIYLVKELLSRSFQKMKFSR
ncbi:glycosyltransferase family 32 protein [Pedobacter rhodius]|uniref:Glycosyltransferase n=1 Tax=Pedobacter rhodius TaxID=3004098 RepID=A0ABT4KSA9_9SPHI|nr:glycosyltransferase [Pedobacter sp. SJ11]MCZ4221809.1 glycosyltransferase [Pedobacter sp. SJ11]